MFNTKSSALILSLLFIVALSWGQIDRDPVINIIYPDGETVVDTDFVNVEFYLAPFFSIGDSGCTDCDGYIELYLNDAFIMNVTAGSPALVTGLTDGPYFLEMVAVDPDGNEFIPALGDTTSFFVDIMSVADLCPVTELEVTSSDTRNYLEWNEPRGSGGIGGGDYLINSIPYDDLNTNVGMGDDWDVTFGGGDDVAYTFNTNSPITLEISLCDVTTDYDTKLEVFTITDDGDTVSLAYDDDGPFGSCPVSPAPYTPSLLEDVLLDPGQYYIVVDGYGGATGNYGLHVIEATRATPTMSDIKETLAREAEKSLASGYSQEQVDLWWAEFRADSRRTVSREIDPACGVFIDYAIYDAVMNTLVATADTTIFEHSGLTNGQEYCYYVVATYQEGDAVASPTACAIPEAFVPAPPTNVAGIPLDEEVFVTWTNPWVPQLGIPYSEDFGSDLVDMWTSDEESNWSISATVGNPAPAAHFSWTPSQDNYDQSMYSPIIPVDGTMDLELVFDYYLSSYNDNGLEFLTIEYLDGGSWVEILELSNTMDIPWTTYTDTLYGITGSIQLRLRAHGTDSFDINNWDIDNVALTDVTTTRDMTGSMVVALNEYISGTRQFINFNAIQTAPDTAYCDSFAVTFPAGVVINAAGPELLGAGSSTYPPEAFNGIDGQTISWGTDNNDAAGGIYGTLEFWADLTIGDTFSGPITCNFHFSDDGWDTPLDVDGTFDINERVLQYGDFLGFNVYVDDDVTPTNDFVIPDPGYLVTGLTNGQAYDFNVTAAYYPSLESTPVTATATPTWLYGDVTGVITDPADNLLDSAEVSIGGLMTLTDASGEYLLEGLEPGIHTVNVNAEGFDRTEAEVEIFAQEVPVVQDFTLIPKLGKPGMVEAFGGDMEVDLTWRTPGAELPGEWIFYHDGTFENAFASTDGGMGLAQLFTPPAYPATIQSIRFHTSDFGSPTQDLEVWVYASDGITPLAGPIVLPGVSNDWIEIDIDDATIDAGGFLLATYNVLPDGPYVSVDDSFYDGSLFFGNATDGWDELGSLGYEYVGSHEALISAAGRSMVMSGNGIQTDVSNTTSFRQPELATAGELNIVAPRLPDIHTNETSRTDSLTGYNVYQLRATGDTLVATTTDVDTLATISVAQNYADYCFAVKAIWDTDLYDTLESKYSNDACATTYKFGDIDFDNTVTVTDLSLVVDLVLGVNMPTFEQARGADVNRDGFLNIQDIILIVDIIYGTPVARTSADAGQVLLDLQINSDRTLEVILSADGAVRGLQFTIENDQKSLELSSASIAGSNTSTELASHVNDDNSTTYIVYRTDGLALDLSVEALVRISLQTNRRLNQTANLQLSGSQVADMQGNLVPVVEKSTVYDLAGVPTVYALHQNFPNPFNPTTDIQFDLPDDGMVQLMIYNITGQQIRTLISDNMEAGFHKVRWNGMNDLNQSVATGVYFYQLTAGDFHATKKMVILK